MRVKIDTKEKFQVLTLIEPVLSANIAEGLTGILMHLLKQDKKNVVLKLGELQDIDESGAEGLARIQQTFYENNASFVICEVSPELENKLEEFELLELMNITPTESEAWDIVQMEEIERELMDNAEDI